MNQFDVLRLRDGSLYCVLQAQYLLDRTHVMIAPLAPQGDAPASKLTPALQIDGASWLLDVNQQIPVRMADLRRARCVASLAPQGDAIFDALNMLYWGI